MSLPVSSTPNTGNPMPIAASDATYSGSERTALIGQDPTLLTSTLANPSFDYVALGHIHKYQDLHKGSMPPVVYSGSLERIDFGEEHETKGFVIGSIDIEKDNPSERTTRFEFIPVAARPFVTIEVEIDHATLLRSNHCRYSQEGHA